MIRFVVVFGVVAFVAPAGKSWAQETPVRTPFLSVTSVF